MLQAYPADMEELAAAAIAKPPIDVPYSNSRLSFLLPWCVSLLLLFVSRWPLEHPSYTVDDFNALEVDDAISYQALSNGTHLVSQQLVQGPSC